MKRINLKLSIISLLIFSFFGCLENRIAPELNLQTESAIELLAYLESNGDYINSDEINQFVSASEVFENRTSYLIIDVRTQTDFAIGHIENAVNVEPKSLLNFIKSQNLNLYPKVVIVSESGQSATYYTTLLRFAEYPKVYSMEYGMAAWHQDFAAIWLDATKDFRTGSNNFTNEEYPKPGFSKLPQLSFANSNVSVKEKLEERVNVLLTAGFNETLDDTAGLPKYNFATLDNGQASIRVTTIYGHYNYLTNTFDDHFILCFGNNFLYRAHSLQGPFAGQGHLPTAVQFLPLMDLRSTNYLQTIPSSTIVAVYDVNGHASAKVVAYLRLLGYDAKSILFGANNLFYSRVNFVESLRPFAFNQSMIMNLPYVTGN
jgi:rhodanese-related sulfurtransferase